MEFRDFSSANIVFVSVLDHSRNIQEITDRWGLEHEKFSDQNLNSEIDRLVDNKIMRETGKGLIAHLGSQSFRTELENHIKYMHSEETSKKVLEDLSANYSLLRSTGFREEVFEIEKIQSYYGSDPEEARENPLNLIYRVLKVMEGESEPETKIEKTSLEFI